METKKVRIKLAALTRVEYEEVLEVPADMTDEELDELVDQRYEEVDGGLYWDDEQYWERSSSCEHVPADPDDEPSGKVSRADGDFAVEDIPGA